MRGSHARVFDSDPTLTDDHAGAGLVFEAWTSPRFAVAAEYTFDWNQYTSSGGGISETDYTSVISLSIRLRPL
ncbi:MAG TPA: hypothetical protein VGH63_16130 [Polyangia bacterium]